MAKRWYSKMPELVDDSKNRQNIKQSIINVKNIAVASYENAFIESFNENVKEIVSFFSFSIGF